MSSSLDDFLSESFRHCADLIREKGENTDYDDFKLIMLMAATARVAREPQSDRASASVSQFFVDFSLK